MIYKSIELPDNFSVEGIVMVLSHIFSVEPTKNSGESHDFPEILYINKGKHKPIIDGVAYTLSSGQMIIYAPSAFHSSREKTGAEGYILSFRISTEAILPLCNKVITLTPTQKQTFLQIFEDGRSCFRRLTDTEKQLGISGMALKETADAVTLQRIKKQLEFFLTDISTSLKSTERNQAKHDRDFELVIDFLNRNLCRSLTLSEIADGCEMSVSKLKLLFREKSGGGVIDFFTDMKIERAKELIRKGNLNYTQIAETLGFNSLHYFSRMFKKITSYSPSQYAKIK